MKLSELWEAQAMGGREDPSNGLAVMADLRHRFFHGLGEMYPEKVSTMKKGPLAIYCI